MVAHEGPHDGERAARELVVAVHEEQVRPLRPLDHALPRRVAEVLVAGAADEHLVAGLELLDDTRERAAQGAASPGRDDHGEGDPGLAHVSGDRVYSRPAMRRTAASIPAPACSTGST
jgi:hypothetical protein